MTKEINNGSQEISKDLFGSKLELKKIFFTFFQVFKNIKVVQDDFQNDTGNYTRPVKYALSVIAPYVIILQLFDVDMTSKMIELSQQANAQQLDSNPEMSGFFDSYIAIYTKITEIQYEFLPVIYAIIYIPVFAFWIRIFFRRKNLTFSFYYALGTYVMMSLVAITFPLNVLGLAGFLDLTMTMQISLGMSLIFYVVAAIKVFGDGVFESIAKMLLVFVLMFMTIVIPMVIIVSIGAIMTMPNGI